MRSKTFNWPLFLSPFISRVGDSLYLFGLNWFVVKASGSTALLGIVQAVGGITLLCGDLFCGVLIDNYNRKRILVASEFICLLACFSFAVVIDPENPAAWQLIGLTCMLDVGVAFSFPAAKAIVPEILASSALQRFNAFSNTALNLADIVTPLLGGMLLTINWIDFRSFLLINGLSFTLSFMLLVGLKYETPAVTTNRLSFKTSLLSGFEYVGAHKTLIENVILSGFANVLFAAVKLVLPFVVNHFYQADPQKYSFLLTGLALGGILGGLRLTLVHRPATRNDNYRDLILAAWGLIVAGLVRQYWVLLAFAFVYGFAMASFNIRAFTMTQDMTENAYLGRIFGIWFIALDGFQPLGSFTFGFLTDYTKNLTFMIIGVVLLVGLLLIRLTMNHDQVLKRD
ncbi:MFS transporter [Secundilactobacillus paracollinoides]|uniref:MFS transporter permease n=1 Tax=Secundilactobacillus paracollinoides TaxID=240427 RepID=A0A1B2IZ67_9LACO|nr:MFS transporter [Secundilactobacillus paracollinoides]ANZ61431.1 MFS transporter permease [Secundilactobacillus paracollinoides]ANZ67351.1 MFS transporter permease [Secundilactobacillus paracollinoides]